MSRRASWDSIVSERVVPVIRHSSSDSDLEIKTPKRNFPPVPVKKSKLSLFRKVVPHKYSTRSQVDFKQAKLLEVGTSDPQAIGKKPSAWERTKSAIYNSPSLLARIISLGRSGNSTSASDSGSNTSLRAGILSSLSVGLAPLLSEILVAPPYSSSCISAAAEEFLSNAPGASENERPSFTPADSHISSRHNFQRPNDSIERKILESVDTNQNRALQSDARPRSEHSISYGNQNASDQLVDVSTGPVSQSEYEASDVQFVSCSEKNSPCLSAPSNNSFPFPSKEVICSSYGPVTNYNTSGFIHQQRDESFSGKHESIYFPSQPLSGVGVLGANSQHSLPGGSESNDSFHFEPESRIPLSEHPRPIFSSTQLNKDSFSQPATVSQMALADLQSVHKGNRAVTMLLQVPSFNGDPSTMRFDRWIKLFDNIVAMSNWTDDEIVNMLVTKVTGATNEMLQNILDSVTKEYAEIKKLLQERFHGNEDQDYFQSQLEEVKRKPGENVLEYGFRLKNVFERGYPKQTEENTRFAMLRHKFLSGLDIPLKNKVRYKKFKHYEELLHETEKYDRRIESENEENNRQVSVDAVTASGESGATIIPFNTDTFARRIEEVFKQTLENRLPQNHSPNTNNLYHDPHARGKDISLQHSHPFNQDQITCSPRVSFNHSMVRPTCSFCGNHGHHQWECRKRAARQKKLLKRDKKARMLTCSTDRMAGHLTTAWPNGVAESLGLAKSG